MNPWGANWAGAAAGSATASYAGQAAGNLVSGNDPIDLDNYNHPAAGGAALGGALGGPIGNLVGKRYTPTQLPSSMGKPIQMPNPKSPLPSKVPAPLNHTPGNVAGAVSEGIVTGSGEYFGAKLK